MECKHLYEKVKESNFLETLFYHWDECKFLAVKEYGEMPLEDEDRLYKRTKLNKIMTKILNDCGKWNIIKSKIYLYGEDEHKAQVIGGRKFTARYNSGGKDRLINALCQYLIASGEYPWVLEYIDKNSNYYIHNGFFRALLFAELNEDIGRPSHQRIIGSKLLG